MTATTLQPASSARSSPMDRARALARLRVSDAGFRLFALGAAVLVLVLLLGVVISLFIGALPAFRGAVERLTAGLEPMDVAA